MPSLDSKGLSELAGVIATRAKEIETYLSSHDLPQPSLHKPAPEPDFLPLNNKALLDARRELVEAAGIIAELAEAPYRNFINKFIFLSTQEYCLKIVDGFNVADHVPLDGSISYEELSRICGVNEPTLRRIVRYLLTMRFFDETPEGEVKHSPTSRPLASDPLSRHLFGHMMKVSTIAGAGGVKALKDWPDQVDPTHCAFTAATGGKTIWTMLQEDKQLQENFNGAMEWVGRASKLGMDPSGPGFDWSHLPQDSLVVDCGGGVGHISKDLAEQHSHLRFVVQDLDQVLSTVPEKSVMGGRVRYEEHSFFDPQPIKNADVYMFRRIFHDWDNRDAARIVEALVPSMKAGARLAIFDFVVPKRGAVPLAEESMMVMQDVGMMGLCGAQERTLDEWQPLLFQSSGGKLRLEGHGRGHLSLVRVP